MDHVASVEPCVAAAGGGTVPYLLEVLGISPKEQDPKVIEEAACVGSAHVRTYQLTRESECTLLLNEIAQALITLLDPVSSARLRPEPSASRRSAGPPDETLLRHPPACHRPTGRICGRQGRVPRVCRAQDRWE